MDATAHRKRDIESVDEADAYTRFHDDGMAWTLALIGCALAFAIQGGLSSLSDPDLPQHLSLGEWITLHGAFPFSEPFAWTRAGAPYYAYSWLPEVGMYRLMRATGPLGLHVLAALATGATVLASAFAAKEFGSRWSGVVAFGVGSGIVAMDSTPFLRPQLFMFALVPLAWAMCARVCRRRRLMRLDIIVLALLNIAAANTHITFPVMAVPLVLLALQPEVRRHTLAIACAATLIGWLISPYGLEWIDVFRLNFARNALTTPPVANGEMRPGFLVSPVIGVIIAALPLIATPMIQQRRERLVFGLMWFAGLCVFAFAFKGLGPWWWCATPFAIAALRRLPRAGSSATRRAFAGCMTMFAASLAITNIRLYHVLAPLEGGVSHRTLPSAKAYVVEPIARWIEENVRPGVGGRLLTTFNYGSYLKWRLPRLSESIDGRTIFPDSAALPDAPSARKTGPHLGPWRSSDLAIVPLPYAVARRLDSSPEWRRICVTEPPAWAGGEPRAALWVKRTWFDSSAVARRPSNDSVACDLRP